MQLNFVELKVRNFLSFGNAEQTIKLDKDLHTLICGLNKDKAEDDAGNQNGCGKTAFMQALHYCLFGKAIGNKITLPTLVNNINKKHMEVTLTFNKDGVNYRIERGRNPQYLRLYKEDEEITNEALGDSRDTQSVIEEIVGMSPELFCQTVLLSCSVPIFMDETTANQKIIIEKVLGIDVITKKINALKEVIKQTKNDILNEEFRVTTVNSQNNTTRESYKAQLAALSAQKENWDASRKKELEDKTNELNCFKDVDFNAEFNLIKAWEHYLEADKKNKENSEKLTKLNVELEEYVKTLDRYTEELKAKQVINFEVNEEAFDYNEKIDAEYNRISEEKAKVDSRYNELVDGQKQISLEVEKLKKEKLSYQNNVCPTCGQMMDKEKADKEIERINNSIQQYQDASHRIEVEILEINAQRSNLDAKLNDSSVWVKKETQVKDRYELLKVKSEIDSLKANIAFNENGIKSLKEQIDGIVIQDITKPDKDSIFSTDGYQNSLNLLFEAKAHIETLKKDVENLSKEEKNPFVDSIIQMQAALDAIQDVDSSTLKELKENQEHNEILLKLLNSPSSYIRQAILDKSLDYLNNKIKFYLNKLGSLHLVTFNNDMSITIKGNGVEYGTVSSGEQGRITLALTLAFRDAWESLSGCSINLLMIDEMIDRMGLDINGKQMLLRCIKDKKDKNIFLVTHDASIAEQISNKIVIVKERNFSTIQI